MPTKTGKHTHLCSDCRPHCSTSLASYATTTVGGTRAHVLSLLLTLPTPLREGIAAEADLACFENHMTAYYVPRTRSRSRSTAELCTLLQGDLTSVALSISTDQAGCYSTLKKAILTRLGITLSAWLDPNPRSSETVSQVYHRSLDVALTCLRDCNSIEDCASLITQEVVYRQLQPSVAQLRMRTEATYGTGHGPSSGCLGRRRKI